MNRPTARAFRAPRSDAEMPKPVGRAGFITETNASWRTERPVIDSGGCIGCLHCYLVCPEGAVFKQDGTVAIDLDFCKGCGICANECPKRVIAMIAEEE
ncbi:MAG: 4Fe-4S binding protein [Deltaproteobacteria bacterium]|nr:4Fe-4S binding protein [Deltaproteobacteria bacterium]